MPSTQYWISDSQLNQELGNYLKRRDMEQKFLYLGDGATKYYHAVGDTDNVKKSESSSKEALDFFVSHLGSYLSSKKFSFISLGCGNACQEKSFLRDLLALGYNFTYIGVDCSGLMLEYAEENLEDLEGLHAKYICADFSDPSFLQDLRLATTGFDLNIVAFLGWTFGNPNQTSMTDSLYNMLGENDRLWFNVLSRRKEDSNIKMRLFDRYTKYLHDSDMNKFQFTPLENVGIPFENGKMILETSNEQAIGTIVFTFGFMFTKKTVITYRNETIHFLPGEKINLLTVRNYDPDMLVSFFQEHNFDLIAKNDRMLSERLQESQFLFKKSPH